MAYIKQILRKRLLQLISLLAVIRFPNLLLILVGQYLTSIFILANTSNIFEVLFDLRLFCLVMSSAISIASGYIINDFYDTEKDLINRPRRSQLHQILSRQRKLSLYFVLNFLSVIIASYVSFNAVIFFSSYIFSIWLYSHKINKVTFSRNIMATLLAITPFFATFIYFKNYDYVIFVHALFLFIILFMKGLVKDMENVKGDLTYGYQTFPVTFGETKTKYFLYIGTLLCLITCYVITRNFDVANMSYYFISSSVVMVIFSLFLYKATTQQDYYRLHLVLKFVIAIGVFSIPLIKVNNSLFG